ncbi:hypothetical protein MHU86_23086 [Fragilaria crotonensis]|nr:hypothetical protein MHU86_23086 [Fragilaria crotonensis]
MTTLLVATATFSVMRLDLSREYNPITTRLIIIPAVNEQTASRSIQKPKSSSAKASTNTNIPLLQRKASSLWMYVEQFSEGMATWKISLAEILTVAKKLNATVVEPCILHGTLRACDNYTVRLNQIYNVDRLRQFHPHIVSYEDYQTMLAEEKPTIVPMCFQHPQGIPAVAKVCGNLTNLYKVSVNAPLQSVLQPSKGTTVMHIAYYRQGGLRVTRVGRETLVGHHNTTLETLDKYFAFDRQHYDTVDYLLELMGIANNSDFDVIHWRAEKVNIDYDDCANKIMQARQAMGSNTTVLMSSINQLTDMLWYNPRRYNQSDAIRNLNRLLDSGFHKLDQVLDKVRNMIPDKIVLPVWDQIIAQKARHFATCTKQCADANHLCKACNFRGNFAQTTVDLRTKIGKSSYECWPTE